MLLFLSTLAAATEDVAPFVMKDLGGNSYVRDSKGRLLITTLTGEVTISPPKALLIKHETISLAAIDEQSESERLTILNAHLGTSYLNIHSLLETEAAKYCKMTINPSDIATVMKYTALDLFRYKLDQEYGAAYSNLAKENATDEAVDLVLAPYSLLKYETVSYLRTNKAALESQMIEITE